MATVTSFLILLRFLGLYSFFKNVGLLDLFTVSLIRCFLGNSFGELFLQFKRILFAFNLCLRCVDHVM